VNQNTNHESAGDAADVEGTIEVLADGRVVFLHDDRLVELCDDAAVMRRFRASHVEPVPGGWTADLSPVGGPTFGPFRLRGDALRAEREWLDGRLASIVDAA